MYLHRHTYIYEVAYTCTECLWKDILIKIVAVVASGKDNWVTA